MSKNLLIKNSAGRKMYDGDNRSHLSFEKTIDIFKYRDLIFERMKI